MHTHNDDPFSLFANHMPVHVHNLQTYDSLLSMHIIIYKEIKLFLFSSIFYLYTILFKMLYSVHIKVNLFPLMILAKLKKGYN